MVQVLDEVFVQLRELGENEAVEKNSLPEGTPLFLRWVEVVDGGVDREKRINVPQLDRKLFLKRADVAE